MFLKRYHIITLNFGRFFVERSGARQMKSGSKNPRAHARTFPAKCVFILHFLHLMGYSPVKQRVVDEGAIFLNPSPEGWFWEDAQGGEGSEGKKHRICVYDARVCAYACVPSANIFLRGSLIEMGAEKDYLWGRLTHFVRRVLKC